MKDFKRALRPIVAILYEERARVFRYSELRNALRLGREQWGEYLKGIPVDDVIQRLEDENLIERKRIATDELQKDSIRYLFNKPSPYEIALSLKSGSYLSHGSAVFIHGLNNQLPKTIYVNKEQSKKPPSKAKLSQEAIDKAFAKEQRDSKSRIHYDGYELALLNGKHTKRLQVVVKEYDGYPVEVTSLERTLIDIAVRPNYSGGTSQVLEAYRGALKAASINTIQATLKKLEYTYPYHQVIGFYLEQAGFPVDKIALLKNNFPIEFDFYLEYSIPESAKQYSKEWRLFYPKGL